MINEQLLRLGLQKLLVDTEAAIRERLTDEPELEATLRERHSQAVRAERTEGSKKGFDAFSSEAITQAAAHWLLGCVFVRFLEDNGWLDGRNAKVAWISGAGDRLVEAENRRTLFLRPDPRLTDRDYLLHVFSEVAKQPGVAGLFDPKHNPLYSLQPTAQGAEKILQFFQRVDPDTNVLIHDFSDATHATRFLGDLYQNLSKSARKRYALCQTPGFVVDFILDRTLTPALDAFGIETVRIIDPSCGSGHFLLEAFGRIYREWQLREPGTNPPALVQRALDSVFGVDLNPFAVEISRFRLLVAALESSGIRRLRDAPNFRFQLAAGDSLLHGSRIGAGGIERDLFKDRMQHFYDSEDSSELNRILGQSYHVVVGNPPYINVSDSVLREAYRTRFTTCHGKYQLGVPFTERFFDLTLRSESTTPAGWMGMITSNAFMKRSFGKKLIEEYLRHRDLTHVIDTSGVYLPGHGTPTAILLARNRKYVAETIRSVRGIRGETQVPDDPARAPVWLEIRDHVDEAGFEGMQVSVGDSEREAFNSHPWTIGGGGAAELKEAMDGCSIELQSIATSIGITSFTLEDDVFQIDLATARRMHFEPTETKVLVVGEMLKDWLAFDGDVLNIFPYDSDFRPIVEMDTPLFRFLWPARTRLSRNVMFGGRTKLQAGFKWYEYGRLTAHKLRTPLSITFGFVGTHNSFVLDLGGKIFNRSAPVIKLPTDATADSHLELMAFLNSSSGCFWLKQVCFPKGGDHVGTEGARIRKIPWDVYYEFDSTQVGHFPIPVEKPTAISREIQKEANLFSSKFPENLAATETPSFERFAREGSDAGSHLARMIALQEELDWHCYRLYGILDGDLTLRPDQIPAINLGERAFEIALARAGEEPLWFERHHSTPITELPAHWPEAYQALVEQRIRTIAGNRDLALIERPEYKRRWNLPTWGEMESVALKSWLLDRMEVNPIWQEHTLVTCAQLRDALVRDAEWREVAELYNGDAIEDLDSFVTSLATVESVPFLPVLRYTQTGLRKRAEWEEVWALQRQEDVGEVVEIPVPPKYIAKDFQRSDYWRLRGGLDVPKERFTLYPGLERDSDQTPVLGSAGWSHLEQASALAAYYQRMRIDEGWEPERLKPILAGLLELREWLKQWYNDIDPLTGERLGTFFSHFAETQSQELGFSPEQVLAWQPTTGTKSSRKKKSKTK